MTRLLAEAPGYRERCADMNMENGQLDLDGETNVGTSNDIDASVNANSISSENGTASAHVRRRTSKACDHCNSARRKCDGRQPCGYCQRK